MSFNADNFKVISDLKQKQFQWSGGNRSHCVMSKWDLKKQREKMQAIPIKNCQEIRQLLDGDVVKKVLFCCVS